MGQAREGAVTNLTGSPIVEKSDSVSGFHIPELEVDRIFIVNQVLRTRESNHNLIKMLQAVSMLPLIPQIQFTHVLISSHSKSKVLCGLDMSKCTY